MKNLPIKERMLAIQTLVKSRAGSVYRVITTEHGIRYIFHSNVTQVKLDDIRVAAANLCIEVICEDTHTLLIQSKEFTRESVFDKSKTLAHQIGKAHMNFMGVKFVGYGSPYKVRVAVEDANKLEKINEAIKPLGYKYQISKMRHETCAILVNI